MAFLLRIPEIIIDASGFECTCSHCHVRIQKRLWSWSSRKISFLSFPRDNTWY